MTEELITHYGDINNNTLFSELVNILQRGPITEHIHQFQKLSLRVKNVSQDNLLDLFMGTLKESIHHEVCLFEVKYLEHAFKLARKVECKNMGTRKLVTNNYRENHAPFPKLIRLTPQQMDKRKA